MVIDKVVVKKALIGTAVCGTGVAGVCLLSTSLNKKADSFRDENEPISIEEESFTESNEDIPEVTEVAEQKDTPKSVAKVNLPEGHNILQDVKDEALCGKKTSYLQYWKEGNCISKPAPVATADHNKIDKNIYKTVEKKSFTKLFKKPESHSPSKLKIYELDLLEAAQIDGSGIIMFVKENDSRFKDYVLPNHFSITEGGKEYAVKVDDLCTWKASVGGSTDVIQIFNPHDKNENQKIWNCAPGYRGFIKSSRE